MVSDVRRVNPVFHARTKYIEFQHHFIREKLLRQVYSVQTVDQVGDIFTKALAKGK